MKWLSIGWIGGCDLDKYCAHGYFPEYGRCPYCFAVAGLKHDQDKPHMNLLLQEVPNALVEVSRALRMGEEKYGRGNWRIVENKEDRYLAALMRHLVAIHQGEKNDPESGLSHLAHVAVNALFLLDSEVK